MKIKKILPLSPGFILSLHPPTLFLVECHANKPRGREISLSGKGNVDGMLVRKQNVPRVVAFDVHGYFIII